MIAEFYGPNETEGIYIDYSKSTSLYFMTLYFIPSLGCSVKFIYIKCTSSFKDVILQDRCCSFMRKKSE